MTGATRPRFPAALVPLLAWGATFVMVLAIPLRIVSHGFMPTDDALRHAAKVISGRPWAEVLVLRPDMTLDAHPGWHAILGVMHRLFSLDAHALVLFSVIFLFVVLAAGPLLLLRRPEGWALALVAAALADPAAFARCFQGRPFLVSNALVIVLCLVAPRLGGDRFERPLATALTLLFALATWIHGNWFLFALPIAAFFVAQGRRAGSRLAACWIVGTLLGAALTGHPLGFLVQTVKHSLLALGGDGPLTALAMEFRPYRGSPLILLIACLPFFLRSRRGQSAWPSLASPAGLLAGAGWVLGFLVGRLWFDFGLPAFLVFVARELEAALEAEQPGESPRRLALAGVLSVAAVIVISANADDRWGPWPEQKAFLSRSNPAHVEWLPEPGGILYHASMPLFFNTFYRNPTAPWRYVLGFEPAEMTPENLGVFLDIHRRPDSLEPYIGWISRMKREDRLYINIVGGAPPFPGLQWQEVLPGLWSGRLPR